MLKAVEKGDNDFVEFCRRDVFGTRIACLYNCYSTDYDFVKFWKQTDDDGNIISAVSRIDGDATLSSTGVNAEEIQTFLKIVGFRTVQCEKRITELMGEEPSLDGYVVEYIKNRNDIKDIKEVQADNVFRPKDIYDIIKSANLVGVGDYLPWLSDTTFRINRGVTSALSAVEDGKTVACAMKLFSTETAVLLGAVATRPEYRGRGLAGALVTRLAESEKNKRVELLCKHDSIVEFYKSIGFEVKNEWSIITDEQ